MIVLAWFVVVLATLGVIAIIALGLCDSGDDFTEQFFGVLLFLVAVVVAIALVCAAVWAIHYLVAYYNWGAVE